MDPSNPILPEGFCLSDLVVTGDDGVIEGVSLNVCVAKGMYSCVQSLRRRFFEVGDPSDVGVLTGPGLPKEFVVSVELFIDLMYLIKTPVSKEMCRIYEANQDDPFLIGASAIELEGSTEISIEQLESQRELLESMRRGLDAAWNVRLVSPGYVEAKEDVLSANDSFCNECAARRINMKEAWSTLAENFELRTGINLVTERDWIRSRPGKDAAFAQSFGAIALRFNRTGVYLECMNDSIEQLFTKRG